MCGIAGLWNTQLPEPATTVGAMLEAMRHRGPDGRGTLEYAGGAAGHGAVWRWSTCRTADSSRCGPTIAAWPSYSTARFTTFARSATGWRRPDIASAPRPTPKSSCNCIWNAGLDFHERLRGMYALAIFDWRQTAPGGLPGWSSPAIRWASSRCTSRIATGDRQSVVFSSEMRAHPGRGLVRPEICRQSLAGYLARGFMLQPATMISGVRMLEPGTLERYTPGEADASASASGTMPAARAAQ